MALPGRSSRLAPGSGVPIAILFALVGLAGVLAYQAIDAARAEARASQRELLGYATVASLRFGELMEGWAAEAGHDTAFGGDHRAVAAAAARHVLALPASALALPPGAPHRGQPVWVEVRDPVGTAVFRSAQWTPDPSMRGSWLEAKVGWYGGSWPAGAVADTLGGALAGFTTRVALNSGWAQAVAPAGRRSRLALLLTVFGLTLGLVGVAVVQLRRQQELVRLRDDFVSGVSHELRTPLAQIRLFADLLESGRLASGEQQERSVRVIAEESRRLSYLVENILHFSRGQRGALRLSAVPTEVEGAIREAADAFAPLARAVGTRIVLDLEPGVVARVDHDALRQVLLNLLDNAVKYGPAGQRVAVCSRLRSYALHVWVDDQGPGVPREERGTVWEPYRRLARDAESATPGSGIGLSVVRDLVGLHGGRVAIEDAPGGGARFLAIFPGAVYAGPVQESLPAAAEA